jgi:hypothetical protein
MRSCYRYTVGSAIVRFSAVDGAKATRRAAPTAGTAATQRHCGSRPRVYWRIEVRLWMAAWPRDAGSRGRCWCERPTHSIRRQHTADLAIIRQMLARISPQGKVGPTLGSGHDHSQLRGPLADAGSTRTSSIPLAHDTETGRFEPSLYNIQDGASEPEPRPATANDPGCADADLPTPPVTRMQASHS